MQHENESRENDEANTTKTQEDNQRNKTPPQTQKNLQSNKLNATTTTNSRTTKTAPVVATKQKKAPTKQQQKLQQTTTAATASAAKLGVFTNMSSTSPTAACYTHSSSYVGFLTYLPTYLPIGFLLLALPALWVET
jgi:hypothetical protein